MIRKLIHVELISIALFLFSRFEPQPWPPSPAGSKSTVAQLSAVAGMISCWVAVSFLSIPWSICKYLYGLKNFIGSYSCHSQSSPNMIRLTCDWISWMSLSIWKKLVLSRVIMLLTSWMLWESWRISWSLLDSVALISPSISVLRWVRRRNQRGLFFDGVNFRLLSFEMQLPIYVF